jgi:serine/threonine protein kinase
MPSSTLEGTTLGKYRIVKALGRGGMAQVYKAYHPQLDRYMAIKILRSDLAEEDDFLARFRHEAHAVSGLRHANIVQVFDFDVQDDLYYMVMELLEGDTLRALLNDYRVRNQRMPLTETVRILNDVLSGLSYAHNEGIIHRDIKPANIMLNKKGQAVLTDFGIAQIIGSTQHTASGALMGTLNYMAPEQGLKNQCDRRSDIYSLGIVLFEMLTGYTPFDADTPLAILMKHLNDPLPLPSEIDPSLPPELEKIVLKALAKDPDDRFQSAEEMAEAIQHAAAQLSTSSDQPTVLPPVKFPQQAVFSGASRRQITDHRFADADTDAGIKPTGGFPSLEPEPVSPLDGLISGLTATFRKWRIHRISIPSAIFGGLALFLLANMSIIMFTIFSGRSIMARAWPIEIFLLAGLLALIGWGIEVHWLMIPSGIVLGNALLLAYCSITGRWQDWAFLWVFGVLAIWISIFIPIRINQIEGIQSVWTRAFGLGFTLLCVLLSTITIFLAFLFA